MFVPNGHQRVIKAAIWSMSVLFATAITDIIIAQRVLYVTVMRRRGSCGALRVRVMMALKHCGGAHLQDLVSLG